MAETTQDSEEPGQFDGVKDAFRDVLGALGDRAMRTAQDKIDGASQKLTDAGSGGGVVGKAAAEGGKEMASGGSPVKGALKGVMSGAKDKVKDAIPGMSGSGGSGGGGDATTKAMNIVETIDVGVPVSVAYNQWTQYDQWPDFMKKVEHAEQDEDEPSASFKAQVFWSHRSWDATIEEQVPDERIVWRSTGEKGHVDGCVTFHELAPRLTRILVVLEYYPQGFFEKTGNLWRAPGRRARLELKHFRRHVMMNTILEPDEAEGWRGEIHDEEVTRTHAEVVEAEEAEAADDEEAAEDAESDEYEAEEEPAEEDEEDEYEEEEPAEEGDEDEYEEEEEPGEEEYEEEEPAEEEESRR